MASAALPPLPQVISLLPLRKPLQIASTAAKRLPRQISSAG